MPAAPYQRVHLRLGGHGKRAFKRPRKLEDIIDRVALEMLGREKGLVVCHQDIEHAFAGIPGVTALHHGSVAGDDDFGDIDALFVVGGPFAPPSEIAKLASAEARCRVPYAKPVRTPCVALMADGSGLQFERLAYADPRLQSVHAGIYDSGIIQAIGRARGMNRTANNPVDIHVFANLPLPMAVTTIERWKRPSRLDRMFLAGFVPTNAAVMYRLYPQLFRSRHAATQARHRWGKAAGIEARVRTLNALAGAAWDVVLCQPDGQGRKARPAFVRHDRLAAAESDVVRGV
jgi:hypothetical protein